jgi:hypothetical protein
MSGGIVSPSSNALARSVFQLLDSATTKPPFPLFPVCRMLGSIKAGNPSSLLVPMLGSSEFIGAHLIGTYDSAAEAEATRHFDSNGPLMPPRTTISMPSLPAHLQKCSQSARSAGTARVSRIPPTLAKHMQQQDASVQPAWPPSFINLAAGEHGTLEKALKASYGVRQELGVKELKFGSKKVLGHNVCSLMVDKR